MQKDATCQACNDSGFISGEVCPECWNKDVGPEHVVYSALWTCPECGYGNKLEILAGYGPSLEDICSGCGKSFPFDEIGLQP